MMIAAGPYLGIMSLVLWMILGVLAVGRLMRWRWIMDVLDRLTNRAALTTMVESRQRAAFLDDGVLADRLKSSVIGQDAVCDDISRTLRLRLAREQAKKPAFVGLFAGPPGTGKTYLSKKVAEALERPLLHEDMSLYSSAHAASKLFGAPKGYAGSDTYGTLTAFLRDKADGVVLLDEIEKADPEILKKFLTAFNDGFVTETSDGAKISTKKAIFLLTTNAASRVLGELAKEYGDKPDELRRAAENALKEAKFAPEVLSRIDRVLVFHPLQGLDVARVAALEIEESIKDYGLQLEDGGIDAGILFRVIERHEKMTSEAGGGAREVTRLIEETLAPQIVDAKQKGVRKIALEWDGDDPVVVHVR
jgi:ATP-dependent Clp protease ATP-binding subunit ClpA